MDPSLIYTIFSDMFEAFSDIVLRSGMVHCIGLLYLLIFSVIRQLRFGCAQYRPGDDMFRCCQCSDLHVCSLCVAVHQASAHDDGGGGLPRRLAHRPPVVATQSR